MPERRERQPMNLLGERRDPTGHECRPEQVGEFWIVVDEEGYVYAAGAPSEAHARGWIDSHTDQGRSDTDRANRIRTAFAAR